MTIKALDGLACRFHDMSQRLWTWYSGSGRQAPSDKARYRDRLAAVDAARVGEFGRVCEETDRLERISQGRMGDVGYCRGLPFFGDRGDVVAKAAGRGAEPPSNGVGLKAPGSPHRQQCWEC